MFNLENERTRKSLKAVFENIFTKYEREFEEDDEVDLMSMEVTKVGGHLARLKPLAFGKAFRKPRLILDDSKNKEDDTTSPASLSRLDGAKNVIGTNRARHHFLDEYPQEMGIKSSFNYAIASSQRNEGEEEYYNHSKIGSMNMTATNRKDDRQSFDSVLGGICNYKRSIARSVIIKHEHGCFDCTLLKIINSKM